MNSTCSKIKYDTEGQAKRALTKCKRQSRRHRNRKECRAYQCPLCLGWHLTSERTFEDDND